MQKHKPLRRHCNFGHRLKTPDRRQSKTPILSRNVDRKSIETVFSIVICRPTGDKWQAKTLFLSIFDPRSSIVDYVFDCRLPGVLTGYSEFEVVLHAFSTDYCTGPIGAKFQK